MKDLVVFAREAYLAGDLARAEPLLAEVLRAHDGFADVHNMMGFVLSARGDLAGAERHFERAVELNPSYTEARLNLAVTYNDLGKYEASRRMYAEVRRNDGTATGMDPFVRGKIANKHADVAQAYLDAGCREEAIIEFNKALGLCPTFPDLWTRLGTVYREANQLDAAIHAYEQALSARPSYAQARVLLGMALLAANRPDDAMKAWQQVIAEDPQNKSARMYLRLVESQPRSQKTDDKAQG